MAKKKSRKTSPYLNRELSWLEFNQRVLDQAADAELPALERLKFLAITASNFDEFVRVRVGSLQNLEASGSRRTDPAGMTAEEQLDAIAGRSQRMLRDAYRILTNEVEPILAEAGIRRFTPDDLTSEQIAVLSDFFNDEVATVLTPQAIREDASFPLLVNQTMNLCVRLAPEEDAGDDSHSSAVGDGGLEDEEPRDRFAILIFGPVDARFLTVQSEARGYDYILYEDVTRMFVERFFHGEEVLEAAAFRVTRNADLEMQEDQAADLLAEMESILDARKESHPVRLELEESASEELRSFLQRRLGLSDRETYDCAGPLDLSAFMRIAFRKGFDELKTEEWPTAKSPVIDPTRTMFETLLDKDVLLYHPYQSFDPVVRLIEEAADDPDTLAIKQTLYRTSRDSPIVAALARAAAHGKHVTALVEIKARFDEERNIEWAKKLEQDGVQVIHGVKGLKTHAKVCLIVRRGPAGIQKFAHFGTGNYNESTARLYGDLSYMTSREDLTSDASAFFNAICGYSQPLKFQRLQMAPTTLRTRVLELIEGEIERQKQNQKGLIQIKVNSLVDPQLIDALQRAASEGVTVRLNVRGICCLRPTSKSRSSKLVVTSIIDRYLEHARILHFGRGGNDLVLISSADWMPRNLDRRVELLVPIDDPACRKMAIRYLGLHMKDTASAYRLLPDGSYETVEPKPGKQPLRSQYELHRLAVEMQEQAASRMPVMFEPFQAE